MNWLSWYNELALRALNGIADTVQAWLEEAPKYVVDLVERYWMYLWWCWLLGASFSLLLSIFGIRMIKKWFDERDNWGDPSIWQVFVWVLTLIPWLILLFCCIDGMLKWFLVPEVALIEKFTTHHCF